MSGSRPPPGGQRQSQAASTSPRTALARNTSAGSSDVAVVPDVANPASRNPSRAQRDRQPVREGHHQPSKGAAAPSGNNSSRPGERPATHASGSARSQSGELAGSQRVKDPYRHGLLVDRLKCKGYIAQGKLLLSRAESMSRKEPKTASDAEMANELRRRGDYLCKEGTDSALRLEQEFLNSYSPTMKDFYTPAEVSFCTAIRDVLKEETDPAKRLEKFRARLRTLSHGSTIESDANLRCEYVQVIDQELRLIAGNGPKSATGSAAKRSNQGSVVEDSVAGVGGPTEGAGRSAGRSAGVSEGGSPSKKRDAPDTFERPTSDLIRRNTSQSAAPGRPHNDPSRMNTTLGIPIQVDPARVAARSAGPAGPKNPLSNQPSANPSAKQAISSHPIESGRARAQLHPHPAGIHATGSGPAGVSLSAGNGGGEGGARQPGAGGTGTPERVSSVGTSVLAHSSGTSSAAYDPARGSSSSGGSHAVGGRAPSVSDSSMLTPAAAGASPRAMDISASHGAASGRKPRVP